MKYDSTKPRFILAPDRWNSRIAVIDLDRARDPARDGSADAIVARVRCTPDIDADGAAKTPASGQPVNFAIDPANGHVIVVNHSGFASLEATRRFQHGYPGALAFLDLPAALATPDDPLAGLKAFVPTGTAGPVGCALAPDGRTLLVSSAEAAGCEDGGRQITLIDLGRRSVLRQVQQRLAPNAPADARPSAHPGPHESFGLFPCPNGVAVSSLGYAFAGNGGTDDISMFDLGRMMQGDADAELARIPVDRGPFGLAVSNDGRWLAAANREDARTGEESNLVSLIDVEEAHRQGDACERLPILVGTDDPSQPSRPFATTFSNDDGRLLATAFRTNKLAIVDIAAARRGDRTAFRNMPLTTPDGGPARPRGVIMLPGEDVALVVGGAKGAAERGVIWLVDIEAGRVISRVSGVGDEPYSIALW